MSDHHLFLARLQESGVHMSGKLAVSHSEEFTLYCDIPACEASLSMVSGVPRAEHGWGRVSTDTNDYDLCNQHYRQLNDVLEGKNDQRL